MNICSSEMDLLSAKLVSGGGNSLAQSDLSSNADDTSYLEKYTHIRAIVVQQERDLQQMRIKYKALETMQELFKEIEGENSKLRKDRLECESAISVLQSRLASYGHSTSISFDDNDVFQPGPNRDLIKELSKENAKLRQSLKFATVDPACMENVLQENRKLKQETEKNELEFHRMKDDLQSLQKVVRSSADQKDLKLLQLHQYLEELNKAKNTSELLCHSLSLESTNLKHKLQEMAAACQHLAKQLDQKCQQMPQKDSNSLKDSIPSSPFGSMDKSNQYELKSENTRLQIDLMSVAKKLKDAADTNQRWQKFSDQREEYVKQLIKEIEGMKRKSSRVVSGSSGQHEKAEDHMHAVQAQWVKEREKLEEQNRSLHIQLKNHKDIIVRMKEQISIPSDSSVQEQSDRINMLEHQVRICAEDFETERRDREKAQAYVTELQKDLKSVQDQLRRHQVSDMNKMHYERQAALQQYQEEQRQYPQLVARGFAAAGELDHYDGSPAPPARKPERQKEDFLQCPRCMKGFPSDRHNELLEHMDNCVD